MESDSYLMALKCTIIETILAETDVDLLDLVCNILITEGMNPGQRLQDLQTG